MKKLYICENCKFIFDSVNSSCPDCGSSEYFEIYESELCPVCNGYHNIGANGKYKYELKACFDAIYSDGRALRYIMQNWSYDEIKSNLEWLNESYMSRTIKDCIWEEIDTIKAFMQFVMDCESAEQGERERIDLIVAETRKAG